MLGKDASMQHLHRLNVPATKVPTFTPILTTQNQFCKVYNTRLQSLSPRIKTENYSAVKVSHLADGICWVLGSVYLECKLKVCVLEEIGRDAWMEAPSVRSNCASDDGEPWFEALAKNRATLAENRASF